jgi:hypothetical protein
VKSQNLEIVTSTANTVDTTKPNTRAFTDQTITLFGDTSFNLTLHMFDITNLDEETHNAILTFSKHEKSRTRVLFTDSLYCLYPDIELKDFNNDRIKDVLVFYYTGGRANPTYHLYLTDLKNRRLIRVMGFEKLPNPFLDSKSGIITSIALSGSNYYTFYKINSKNKLINLRHGYEESPTGSNQYDEPIRQIQKKKE